MKARVFFDAFAECVAGVGMARKQPIRPGAWRAQAILAVITAHGPAHAEEAGIMFDRLWNEFQNGAKQ